MTTQTGYPYFRTVIKTISRPYPAATLQTYYFTLLRPETMEGVVVSKSEVGKGIRGVVWWVP